MFFSFGRPRLTPKASWGRCACYTSRAGARGGDPPVPFRSYVPKPDDGCVPAAAKSFKIARCKGIWHALTRARALDSYGAPYYCGMTLRGRALDSYVVVPCRCYLSQLATDSQDRSTWSCRAASPLYAVWVSDAQPVGALSLASQPVGLRVSSRNVRCSRLQFGSSIGHAARFVAQRALSSRFGSRIGHAARFVAQRALL